MKIKAQYENGKLVLDRPIFPKRTELTIEIDDDELGGPEYSVEDTIQNSKYEESVAVPEATPGSLQHELNAILGLLAKVRPDVGVDEDREVLLEVLENRYHGR